MGLPDTAASVPPNHSGTVRMAASSGTITIPTNGISFQNNAPWSIELWFSLDALVDNMPLIGKTGEFCLAARGTTLWAALNGQTVALISPGLLATGIPYYASVIYDGLNMSLYLNGALAAQATTSASPAATGNPLVVGGGFFGEIQGVRLWSQATNATILSANQFSDFASGTPNLLAQLDFTVDPPVDSSGQGVVPVLAGAANFVSFVPAGVLGTNSFCDPYNDGAVNPGGSQADFTVNAWICPVLSGELMYVFANGVQESNSGMTLGIDAGGQLFMQVGDSSTLTSQAVLQDGIWVYVAATWSQGTGTLFINGTQDSSQGGMTLAGTLASGEPLVGAIASVGAQLPILSFQGSIQSVCVWTVALTQAQISQYQTASPQTDPNCVAYYDLSQPPARNQVSFNPLGLVAGAALAPAGTALASAGSASTLDGGRIRIGRLLAGTADVATLGGAPGRLDPEADFAALLERFELGKAQNEYFRSLHSANLAAGRGAAHVPKVRIDALSGGGSRVVHIGPAGEEEIVFEGDLDPCTSWCIQVIVAVVGALWTALGPALNYTKFASQMTTFFGTRINTIGIMPQLSALFQAGVSGQNIYKALKLLHEYSLLTPILKLSYQTMQASLSWWTILSIGVRVVLLMSPSAPLEILWFVAQLAYSIYSIQQVLAQRPAGCLTAVPELAPIPVADRA